MVILSLLCTNFVEGIMRYYLIVFIAMVLSCPARGQSVRDIQLKQEKLGYSPRGYCVTDVTDDRYEQGNIGVMSGNGSRTIVNLQYGASAAISSFITKNVAQNKANQAVSLHIATLEFDAKRRGAVWNIDANIVLTFYVGEKKIIEYSGKGQAKMDTDPAVYMETFIRQAIKNDLKKFDEWWAENKGRVAVRSDVKVNVTLAKTSNKPDNIVYDINRPLQIADFKGRVDGQEQELAVTSSGIGLGYSGTTKNSQVVVDVVVTPYFNKAQSWFKERGKNTRVLAHEQTHFDITAIKACELVNTIKNTTFTQENYAQLLQELQEKNAQESNEEEMLYDKETNHGIIRDAQAAWEKKITEQVRTMGCYQ